MKKRQALIINIYKFTSHDPRSGSTEDADNLTETLEQLGYQVQTKENLTSDEIIEATFATIEQSIQ